MIDIHTLWVLLIGVVVISSGLIEAGLTRIRIPGLVGYLLLGVSLSLADGRWHLLSQPVRDGFGFLADMGVIALLFQVGLQSHPAALARKLPQALRVWVGDVLGSGAMGFVVAYYALDLSLITSSIVATALTATSVGVSVAAWQSRQALDSGNGQLLLDLAELDDISAVALMALVFAILPTLQGAQGMALSAIGLIAGSFLVRFAAFIALCYGFALYLEPRLTRWVARLEPPPQRMLTVIGAGFIIAALADLLGFSLAIGALFAGLVFSRDPQAIKTERSFRDLYAFLTPFFFIQIGLQVSPEAIGAGTSLGAVLLAAAIVGKVLGAGVPTLFISGATGATLLGISMIPRAEIAMIVVHRAQQLGEWAMPRPMYAGMVFVSLVSSIGAPLILYRLLQRWPQSSREESECLPSS